MSSRVKMKSNTILSNSNLRFRNRNCLGGRPKVMDQEKITIAQSLYEDGKTTLEKICETLNTSRATFYRHVKQKAA